MRKISIEMSQFLLATTLFFSSTYWERVMLFVKGFRRILLIQYIRPHTVTVTSKSECPEKELFVTQNLYSTMSLIVVLTKVRNELKRPKTI